MSVTCVFGVPTASTSTVEMSQACDTQLRLTARVLTCTNDKIWGNEGPRRRRQPSRGVADAWRSADMSQVTPACAQPTAKFPQGRMGTEAGYAAHRRAGEAACEACLAANSLRSMKRLATLSPEGLERRRLSHTDASRRYRERTPERSRAATKKYADAGREIIRAAKDRPCLDCGVQYPFYVMQFDHLDPEQKHFGLGGAPGLSKERLLAEIAKCEVVCANCHAERTYQRAQARREVEPDAMD